MLEYAYQHSFSNSLIQHEPIKELFNSKVGKSKYIFM